MFEDEFIVDGIQGGAGNQCKHEHEWGYCEQAIEMLCGQKGDYTIVHPNDHVNMSQSTNDEISTAGKLTVLDFLEPLGNQL